MRRSSRIRRMGRMLRRRIRKTETAWRKLCRFLCFSAPIHWGTRVASAIHPVRAGVFSLNLSGELRSAERGRLRRPPQGAKRKGHLRFPFLFELLPFPCFLIWRRFPICDRFEKGNGSRVTTACLSPPFRSSQIAYCYTYRLLYAGCGITVPHNSLAGYYRQGLRG